MATRKLKSPTGETVETYYELHVESFIFEDQEYTASPPIPFKSRWNEETELFEITGRSVYQDVFVYGERLSDALDILKEEVLPILWEDCISGDGAKLSKRAKEIAADLEGRVKNNASQNKRN